MTRLKSAVTVPQGRVQEEGFPTNVDPATKKNRIREGKAQPGATAAKSSTYVWVYLCVCY